MTVINVNGAPRTVTASPSTPLLWALRDELSLRAAKYGCGQDQCGACTVLVGGRPLASCQLNLGDVADQEVTTLEVLVDSPAGQRVVTALAAANAGQCGFCLPGIAVTLIDLARQDARVSRSELARALDRHLCRCGSQPRILTAALRALAGADVGNG